MKSALAEPPGFMALTELANMKKIYLKFERKNGGGGGKKNEEAVKTNTPLLASLELFKATSMVILVLEQDPI